MSCMMDSLGQMTEVIFKIIIFRICTYLLHVLYVTISDPFPQDIISKVDANKDKTISATEIIERCFDKIDADQDGKISKQEFINACSNSKEISTLLAPIQD